MEEFKFKRDITFDWSNIKRIDIDKIFDSNNFDNLLNEISKDMSKQLAKEYDKAAIKDAIIKANLYDISFNPYTITKKEKKIMIRSFCKWLLNYIDSYKLNKKEIITQLKKYSKE